jgi:broad-specificity NMP kinase
MKLIFIYGPPAAGKLTVATALAKQTGFKVFHNHLSIGCIQPIFEFGTASFWKLVEMIRLETIAEAARTGQDLVYTFCYAKDQDDPHIEKVVRSVEENGGEVCFVLLTCRRDELEKRVVSEDRKKFSKANNLGILTEILEKYDLFSPVPGRESLEIDNTDVPAKEAAKQIIEHYILAQEAVNEEI